MVPGSDKHPPLAASFHYAFNGICKAIKAERNIKIMLTIFAALIFAAFWLKIDKVSWCILLLANGCMISAELLNTAIEEVVDLVCPTMDERAGRAKDIAAGAVVSMSVVCGIIDVLVFLQPW